MKQKPQNKPGVSRRSSKEVNELRYRMIEAKKILPPGAVAMLIADNPEFDNYKKASRVRLVHSLSIVDEEIIEKFEAIAKAINPKK